MEEDEKQSAAASVTHSGSSSPTSSAMHYDERLVIATRKVIDQGSEDLLKAIPSNFIAHIQQSYFFTGKFNIKPQLIGMGQYSFQFAGFPDMDYVKQFALVVTLWDKKACFPIKFIKQEGFADDTQHYVESILSLSTPLIHDIMQHLATSNLYLMEKGIKELLIQLGIRGFMTILGFRKTTGSQDLPWPSKHVLLQSFNKLNTIVTEEELKRVGNTAPSRLTVGARAFCKHAHRSSEGFWGQVKGTEQEKNETAMTIARSIMDESTWINAHILPHSEHIIEVRNERGYGIRWTIKGEFRGLLEPQIDNGHEKRWRH